MNVNYYPGDEWEISEDRLSLCEKKIDQIIRTKYKNIKGVIILRNGYLAYEKYYNGGSISNDYHIASVTKSFISALIGIALDKGYIKSLDQKVLDFFPEYSCEPQEFIKKSITIEDLLTMSAPTLLRSTKSGNEALDRLRRQKNWINFILDQLGKKRTSENFFYSTSNSHLLSAILERVTDLSTREFANKYLFQPLNIRNVCKVDMNNFSLNDVFRKEMSGWINDPQGITTGGWGLSLSCRDLAKFGLLYLNYGLWKDSQVVSEEWVKKSTKLKNDNYGYLWWIFRNEKIYAALGSGGNGIWVSPAKKMVVAVTAEIVRKPNNFMDVIREIVL